MTAPNILLVDPDADSRAILRALFEHHGYVVSEAFDADTASSVARMRRLDVVVGELMVAGPGGQCVLVEALRRDPHTAALPVVVVTTRVQPSSMDAARAAGAQVVFAKPTELRVLAAAVARLLGAPAPPQGAPT
jgi:CheY-like chemotaxis protein